MGTSASSKGPGSGVAMVPPWVPDVPPPAAILGGGAAAPLGGTGPSGPSSGTAPAGGAGQSGSPPAGPGQQPTTSQPLPGSASPTAPAGRFGGARLKLGKFASGGDRRKMRQGIREYVRKGYGGKSTAVKRFGGTVSTAGTLYGALSNVAGGKAASPGSPLDPALLSGRSAREVMDAVVEAVRPADGTQDAEANRVAIKDALTELLTDFPNADLLNLDERQRGAAIENFVAFDVYQRVALDVGKTIQEKAPTAAEGLTRLKDVKDYIRQTVAASFKKARTAGHAISTNTVNQIVRTALDGAFHVFESYWL